MSAEGGIIRGFIMAETGIPDNLKGKIFRIVMQDTAVKRSDFLYQCLQECFKFCICHFKSVFVGMIKFTVVIHV